ENLKNEYELALDENKKVDFCNEKIINSNKAKEIISFIDVYKTATSENEKLDSEVNEFTSKLDNIQEEIDTNEKLVLELDNKNNYHNDKNTELQSQLLNYVISDVEPTRPDGDFNKKLDNYYAKCTVKIDEYNATKTAKMDEYNDLLFQIETEKTELNRVKMDYTKKRDIRNSVLLDVFIKDKKEMQQIISESVTDYKTKLDNLRPIIIDNKSIIADAQKKKIEYDKEGIDMLYAKLNNTEMYKQTLYRNQILIGNIQSEITAIDNKIYENENAKREYCEDKDALLNAKKTLVGFMDRLNDKIDTLDQKILSTQTKKRYIDDLNSLEYGEKCPVCNNKVMDKIDCTKAIIKTEKALNQLLTEKQAAIAIQKDYVAQLEKINIRLGTLTTRENDSKTYIGSLISTKQAKIELIKRLLQSVEVNDNLSLSKKLTDTIKLSAFYSQQIAEYNNIMSLVKIGECNITTSTNQIQLIEETLLPKAQCTLEKLNEDITNATLEFEKLGAVIGIENVNEQADKLDKKEADEDGVYIRLDQLTIRKQEIENQISQINAKICSLVNRDNTIIVVKNDKELTYPELVLSIIKDKFDEITDQIVKNNEEQQIIQNQVATTKDLIENKKKEFDEIYNQVAEKIEIAEKNKELISNNKEYSSISEKEIKQITKEILSDENFAGLEVKINEITSNISSFENKIAKTKLDLEKNQDYINKEAELLLAKKEIQKNIEDNQKILINLYDKIFLADFVKNEIANQNTALKNYTKISDKLEILSTKNKDKLISLASDTLFVITAGQFSFKIQEDKAGIINNNKGGRFVKEIDISLETLGKFAIKHSLFSLLSEVKNVNTIQFAVINTNNLDEKVSEKLLSFVNNNDIALLKIN
ncbi:MAG: hypothetical protein WCR54_06160, partial [Clostridia bacterium]